MPDALKLGFGPLTAPKGGVLIVFVDDQLRFGKQTAALLGQATQIAARAFESESFKGKMAATLDLMQPAGLPVARLVVVGVGNTTTLVERDYLRLGGVAASKFGTAGRDVTILCDLPDNPLDAAQAAELALGVTMRAYAFDRYKTRRKEGEERPPAVKVTLAVDDVAAARKAWRTRETLADGVVLARDLVNEPANVLYPEEFARRIQALDIPGLAVEVLDEKALAKIGMRALLGVAQGSRRPARVVIMRWNGGRKGAAPLAFIGKGVTFDTGGISIKPAASMEDMKGDMAGAACVTGLMMALAGRKAPVNAIGAIGLTENMPDGNAQRPGDIVTSLSGQTIEIINTDAEGRLVLGDVLWYVKDRFKPAFMINLATLTGAIIVALGQENAGLFSNNDTLATNLIAAGEATGERVWRMPLGPEYDKLIDSKFADMKNTGGRHGGAITAAQFLHRFVENVPWAHLDIAGTAFASPQTDTNKSWGSGWGVRLLDALVRSHYEG
jgi:leucyl aminopeptidase